MYNLKKEGYDNIDCKIVNSGDVMQDGALFYKQFTRKPKMDVKENFILSTIHRAENTNDIHRLRSIFGALEIIAKESQVILPLHPRTKKVLKENNIDLSTNITVIDPIGYLEMVWLINNCKLIMTDSGGLQKEAFFFEKPCVTLRDDTEWAELVENNANILVGANKKAILDGFKTMKKANIVFSLNLFVGDKASEKIMKSNQKIIMKILLLSDCNSTHTIKWATSLFKKGLDVSIFSINKCEVIDYEKYPSIKIYDSNVKVTRSEGALDKVRYLKLLPQLKRVIRKIQPDIVHAHYASSYGTLGALSNFSPFVLSVWGADVFSFPKKSIIHKAILKFNLKRADILLSTSEVMAEETKLYTKKNITVTPFGIDTKVFYPRKTSSSIFKEGDIVIGTIKTLEKKYGIQYLIKAFNILKIKYAHLPLKMLIVGGGSLYKELKLLVEKLGLEGAVVFTGKITFEQVPIYHNMISVFVSLSIFDSESFGVAILEASATGIPVVVSDVGGLPEVVENTITGFVVPKENAEKAAEAIEKLILDNGLREDMGKAGVERVKNRYEWQKCVDQMVSIYESL